MYGWPRAVWLAEGVGRGSGRIGPLSPPPFIWTPEPSPPGPPALTKWVGGSGTHRSFKNELYVQNMAWRRPSVFSPCPPPLSFSVSVHLELSCLSSSQTPPQPGNYGNLVLFFFSLGIWKWALFDEGKCENRQKEWLQNFLENSHCTENGDHTHDFAGRIRSPCKFLILLYSDHNRRCLSGSIETTYTPMGGIFGRAFPATFFIIIIYFYFLFLFVQCIIYHNFFVQLLLIPCSACWNVQDASLGLQCIALLMKKAIPTAPPIESFFSPPRPSPRTPRGAEICIVWFLAAWLSAGDLSISGWSTKYNIIIIIQSIM